MLIGLSVNHKEGTSRIADAYVDAVVKAGGTPVLIPLITDETVYEIALVTQAAERQLPIHGAVTDDPVMIDTFKHVVDEAALFEKAKALHQKIYTIDSHCDTPMYFKYGIDIGKTNPPLRVNPKDLGAEKENEIVSYTIKVDIPKMKKGMLDAVFMVAYLPQGARTPKASQQAFEKAANIINQIKRQIENNSTIVAEARTVSDLKKNKASGKKSIFIGIENGYAIGKDIDNIRRFAESGVKYITLSHNRNNDICDSNAGNPEHNGLSEFGKEVVKAMNDCGIIVDISHTSEKTAFDVLEISRCPVIASHSSVKALCNHPRNLSDPLIKAIASRGGVIQICLYPGFLKKTGMASVKDAVDHIDYIVQLAGIDYVGIGSDFDGGGGIKGLQTAGEFPQITMELLRRGYSDADIAKIWGTNMMRVMEAVNANSQKQIQ